MSGYPAGVTVKMIVPEVGEMWVYETRTTLASQIAFVLKLGAICEPLLNNMSLLMWHPDRLRESNKGEHLARDELATPYEGHQGIAMATVAFFPYVLGEDPAVQARKELSYPQELPLRILAEPGG